jgi:hypothetical protein
VAAAHPLSEIKVLSLELILASKVAANRPKDRLTIPVLRDTMAAIETLRRPSKQ